MVVVALACIIVFVILAAIAMSGVSQGFDSAILVFLHDHSNAVLDLLFSLMTNLGDPIILVPFGLVVCIALLRLQRHLDSIAIAVFLGGSGLITHFLKTVFDRNRPDLWPHLVAETTFSFPSGHATASMAIAICLAYLLRSYNRRLVLGLLGVYVLLVGVSRLYLGVHYPTDIIGGWLVAGFTGVIVLFLANRVRTGTSRTDNLS